MLARRVAEVYLGDRMTPANEANVVAAGRAPNSGVGGWTPAPGDLASFAGRYESPELGTTYTFSVDNGKLTLHRRRSSPITLAPTTVDTFTAEGISYRFLREKG